MQDHFTVEVEQYHGGPRAVAQRHERSCEEPVRAGIPAVSGKRRTQELQQRALARAESPAAASEEQGAGGSGDIERKRREVPEAELAIEFVVDLSDDYLARSEPLGEGAIGLEGR